jgi:predicted nucleic acid-binding protein
VSLYVVDASVAIKWVVGETGTREALALLQNNELIAPNLILPECANILWKKMRRGELTLPEARFAGRLIEGSDLQLRDMLPLFGPSVELSAELDHPAYDCTYLALALQENARFVTADDALVRKLGQATSPTLRSLAVPLNDLA